MIFDHLLSVILLISAVVYLLGILSSIKAIMTARTAQGAIAWAISLITLPYVTLPLYWVLGNTKFHGYVRAHRSGNRELKKIIEELSDHVLKSKAEFRKSRDQYHVFERLGQMPFTHHNEARLLIDGKDTFDAIFEGIQGAQDYILVQYFIVRDDNLGRKLKEKLIEKVKKGVRVYFLYDEIGSYSLSKTFLEQLKKAGIEIRGFKTTRGPSNRFQINFRNHRKIVVVDGREAYVGGLNVGDEYLGYSRRFEKWRDTHVKIKGPAVQCVQLSFLDDWYWATRSVPKLNWIPTRSKESSDVLVVSSGPADELETCGLLFFHAINLSQKRLWITSPYFVPDSKVVSALQLAALRGVDVRIVLPGKADHMLVYLSSFSYYEEMTQAGVKIYRYEPGFMHQKVMLVDDELAAVGTANLDNRSFRINFEITLLFADRGMNGKVAEMMNNDFSKCRQVNIREFRNRSIWFQLAVRIARLMAPIQ